MQKLTQVNVLPGLIMLQLTTKDAVKPLATQWLVEIVTQGVMEYSAQYKQMNLGARRLLHQGHAVHNVVCSFLQFMLNTECKTSF